MESNETVADIVREMVAAGRPPKIGACESPDDYVVVHKFVIEWADRIEAAHEREMEYRALIAGVSLADAVDEAHKRELAAKDDERLTIVANYETVIAAKDAEIAELRECLQEAVTILNCHIDGNPETCDDHKCILFDHENKSNCIMCKWRRALKGVNDESETDSRT